MRGTLLLAVLGASTACQREASGQTVAIVNGEEISQKELNDELAFARVPNSADRKVVLPQVLQRIVDRKLLAQSAQQQGVDRSPEFLSRQRRLNEALLVAALSERLAESQKIPSPAEVDRFIAENPGMFARRARFLLNQLQFTMPADATLLRQLEDDHSLDEVKATLTSLGIPYRTSNAALDSATTPPNVVRQIEQLPPGEPFVVPAGSTVYVSVVTGREMITGTPAENRKLAADALRKQSVTKTIEEQIKRLRSTAEITYQPGFAPPAEQGTATAR